MDRSLRFRVYVTRLDALLGLAFASASPRGLTSPRNVTRRPIMQKVRGHALPCGHSAPTACRHTVSGTISLPSPGFFSPFPRGTSSLSVDQEYLALEDGPPRFPPDCTCPAVLGCLEPRSSAFAYGAVTLYGRPFNAVQLTQLFLTRRERCRSPIKIPRPPLSNASMLALSRFRLFPVRSPLLGESLLLSFRPGT